MIGDLAVVERWLAAVNDADAARLEALSSEQVEIVGPRGQGLLPRQALGWRDPASGPWSCGGSAAAMDSVVVEHVGEWRDVVTGALQSRRVIGSSIVVSEGLVARYVRHDDGTLAALAAAGLHERTNHVTQPD